MKNNLAHLRPAKSSTDKKVSVVQCPACQTKFAVDAALVTDSKEARFHCSRCDNVFGLEPMPAREPEPQFTFDWKSATVDETEGSISAGAADFEVSVVNDSSDDPLAPISEEELGRELFAGLDAAAVAAVPDEPMGYGSLARTSTREFSMDWDPAEDVSPLTPTKPGVRQASRMSPHWSGFFRMAAPVAVYTAVLGIICILSFSKPKLVLGLVEGVVPTQESAPPPELYITDTSVKRVDLESGETVSVVSGKIVNNSQESFSDVQIEGILFDGEGNIVAKKKINAGSSLGKSRIQSLSAQMIDDLQSAKPAKRFELKAGQDFDFTMAVPEEMSSSSNSPEFFSSRVYSVKAL